MTWTFICLVTTVSECERNEGFWSESHGELSDNIVAGGEVQAAGNEIRP